MSPADRPATGGPELTVDTAAGTAGYVDVGEGPVALFLHGLSSSSRLWHNVVGRLAGERRCVALDLPLHGRSPAAPGQDFSLAGLADWVEAFCDALDLTDVDLVANDSGGAVAQIVATRRPQCLRTLTLTNCDTHDNVPPEAFKPTVRLAAAGALASLGPSLVASADLARSPNSLGACYERPELVSPETLRAFLEPVLGTVEAAREFERCVLALNATDLLAVEDDLQKLTVPTLVVWGTADIFFDLSWAYWLRDTIPGVTEVVEIPGGKLFFPDERPDELVPHLRRHWGAHRRAGH